MILANVQIKKFDKELKDLYPDLDAHFSLLEFKRFIDDFYDQLITDWLVQKKLDMAIHGVELIHGKLHRLQLMLEQDLVKKENLLLEITNEREKFIKEN